MLFQLVYDTITKLQSLSFSLSHREMSSVKKKEKIILERVKVMPLVSVLMPVYNGEKFLKEATKSVLHQSFGDFEFIIINDGSKDNTEEIIEDFAKKDNRIVYEKNEKNMGISYTLNKGMRLANGKYIARMDADDISEPERLEKQFEYMENNPNCGVLGTNYVSFYEDTKETFNIVKPENDREIKLCGLFDREFCHPAVMMRTDVFRENGLEYNPEYNGAEDFELWKRAKRFTEFHNLQDFLLRVRINEENLSEHQKTKRALLVNNVINSSLKEILNEDFYVPIFTKLSFALPELKESFNELGEIPLMELKDDCPFTRKELCFACSEYMNKLLKKIMLKNDYLNETPTDTAVLMNKLLKVINSNAERSNEDASNISSADAKLNSDNFRNTIKDVIAEEFYIPIYENPDDTSPLALRESFRVLSEIPLMRLKNDCEFTRSKLCTAASKEKENILDKIAK